MMSPDKSLSLLAASLIAMAVLGPASNAHAGGLEYSGAGARGLARGGAVMAKSEDVNVLNYNPAGLVEIQGTLFMADLQLAYMDACVDPYGFYGWGNYLGGSPVEFEDPETGEVQSYNLGGIGEETEKNYYEVPLDTVCLDHVPLPVPNAGWAQRINKDFGVGFGFIFPAITPAGVWGSENGVIRGKDGDLRPSPVRYMQLSSSNTGAFPTLGVGYRITDMLRVGLAVQWGIVSIHTRVMAAGGAGTAPHNDIIAEVRGIDWFVPGATASIHLVPIDALDIVVAFRAQDRISTSGTLDITSGTFDPARDVYTHKGIKLAKIEQALPWKASAGVRYASRLQPRFHGDGRRREAVDTMKIIHDPMTDERWDIELDVEYQINSMVDATRVVPAEGAGVYFSKPDPDNPTNPVILDPNTIEKDWQDQWVVQLGGSYNIVPGIVALHSGVHYETRGVNPDYMNVDFWPLERFGVHAGITLRLDRRLDFTFSYAHIFQETLTVRAPPHGNRADGDFDKRVGAPQDRTDLGEQLDEDPPSSWDGNAALKQEVADPPMDWPPYIINSGVYTSSIDVVAVGLLYHF